jgi:hypothetical protein
VCPSKQSQRAPQSQLDLLRLQLQPSKLLPHPSTPSRVLLPRSLRRILPRNKRRGAKVDNAAVVSFLPFPFLALAFPRLCRKLSLPSNSLPPAPPNNRMRHN